MAAPTIEPVTISTQPSTSIKQKEARQFSPENLSFLIVSPVETSELVQDELNDNIESADTIDTDVIVDKQDGEMMHTAENLVFRPLFSYRKLQEKRKRLYGSKRPSANSPNTIRRSSYVVPQGYVYYPRPYGGYYYPY